MDRTTRRYLFPSITLTETFLKDLAERGSLETHAINHPDLNGRVKLTIVLREEQIETAAALLTVYEGLPVVDAPVEPKTPKQKDPAAVVRRVSRKPTSPTTRCTICKVAVVDLGKHTLKRHPSAA